MYTSLSHATQVDRDVDIIRAYRRNSVRNLRDQLQALLYSGNGDGGFPILRQGEDEERSRMIGYIGANELEHALSAALLVGSAFLTDISKQALWPTTRIMRSTSTRITTAGTSIRPRSHPCRMLTTVRIRMISACIWIRCVPKSIEMCEVVGLMPRRLR